MTVDQAEDMETSGGYAKEASEDYKKQAEMMRDALKKNDIVICTALIPGKTAPRILTEELIKLMRPDLLFTILLLSKVEILHIQMQEKLILLKELR